MALVLFGLLSPIATFAIAVSGLAYETKLYMLAAISAVYLAICLWTFSKLRRITEDLDFAGEDERDINGKLAALDDTSQFFGSSLKPEDIFRLVSSRVAEIVPFAACTLVVRGELGEGWRIAHASGLNSEKLEGIEISDDLGLPGLAFLSRENETINTLIDEISVYPANTLSGFRAAAAIPLFHDGGVFAVLQLFFENKSDAGAGVSAKLSAIGERFAAFSRLACVRTLALKRPDRYAHEPAERARIFPGAGKSACRIG